MDIEEKKAATFIASETCLYYPAVDTSNSNQKEKDPPIPVTSQEEKELRRVFDKLCNCVKRSKIEMEIKELDLYLTTAKQKVQGQISQGVVVNQERYNANAQATTSRIEQLKQEIVDMDNNPNKKISCADVHETLKRLGHKPNRNEVEEMVWEIDEDLDMCLSWSEFRLMFTRNIMDRSGLEPSRMYHLTQFLIFDHNENCMVSVDETMNMLYARYGKNQAKMEKKLKEMFSSGLGADKNKNLLETGIEGGEISFPQFLHAVEKTQMNMFWGTTKGRITAERSVGLKKEK